MNKACRGTVDMPTDIIKHKSIPLYTMIDVKANLKGSAMLRLQTLGLQFSTL